MNVVNHHRRGRNPLGIMQIRFKSLKHSEARKRHASHRAYCNEETLENLIRDNCKENIDENQIKIEHDQLEDEVKRLTAQAYKLSLFNKDVVHDKMVLLNLAMDALYELFRLYENDKPLWVSSFDGDGETLNIKEYAQLFTPLIDMKPKHFTTEDTRASGTVANTNSALIKTELQIISDLVSVREVQFLRFYKKHAEGVWASVDVSVYTIQEGSQESEIENCRRLPSGCILQDMPNGYCQVDGYFAKTISALESDEVNC
ncbi:hypothetical protein RDI58_015111 [Solanum bulbocastanum]|uniref:START domain-containing protein n=1 Tax=Solanum bulbocastanum TaxID=147425 RepID=A0AAN8TJK0_SOLBU